jgi:hypothetical protein
MAVKWVEYSTGKPIETFMAENGLAYNYSAFSDTVDLHILAAYALGITNGTTAPTETSPGIFTPGGELSRQQAAVMIMNACRAVGINAEIIPPSGFTDIEAAAEWAIEGIDFVHGKGIMSGTGANRFNPTAAFTREQSIVTFNNIN